MLCSSIRVVLLRRLCPRKFSRWHVIQHGRLRPSSYIESRLVLAWRKRSRMSRNLLRLFSEMAPCRLLQRSKPRDVVAPWRTRCGPGTCGSSLDDDEHRCVSHELFVAAKSASDTSARVAVVANPPASM